MTTHPPKPSGDSQRHRSVRVQVPRLLVAALLGLAAAALVCSCGASTKGLIPASDAGPLQSDFETVQQAAEHGDGSCSTTEAALVKTNEDLSSLPSTVDSGLRNNLRQGVANLRDRALALCAQPLVQTTATDAAPPTSTTTNPATTSTPITTPTTTTQTTPTTPATTPTTTTPGGGTPAPGETPGGAQGGGTGVGEGASAGGAGAGGSGAGGAGAAGEAGPPGQEGGK
jgi:hypothetical protein